MYFRFEIETPTKELKDVAAKAVNSVTEDQKWLGLPVTDLFLIIGKDGTGVRTAQDGVVPLIISLDKARLKFTVRPD